MGQVVSAGTRDAAQESANRIIDYWAQRGYVVTAYPYKVKTLLSDGSSDPDDLSSPGDVDEVHGWGVRSDLINGEPRELHERRKRAALAS